MHADQEVDWVAAVDHHELHTRVGVIEEGVRGGRPWIAIGAELTNKEKEEQKRRGKKKKEQEEEERLVVKQ